MSLEQPVTSKLSSRQRLLVFSLFFMTFVLGTSEFVIVGLLNNIATDLNISISVAGTLISGFAIAFAIGTPILTGLFGPLSKQPLILVLIVVFTAGNIISALSETYTLLLVSRVITAAVTGVLIALAMTVASAKIPSDKIGGVISVIFSGFTIASVIGVPVGTLIGQSSGWRMTFWATAVAGVILFVISAAVLPRDLKGNKSSLRTLIKFVSYPRVLLAFLIPALSIGATYTIFTYMTPILEDVFAIPASYISIVLLLYGVVSVFSNLLGGKIAEKNGLKRLRYVFLIQAVILASLYFTSHSLIAGMISIGLMGLFVYLQGSTMQLYFLDLANRHFPSAKELASSLTPISLNIGIAAGSTLGGWTATEVGLIHVTWTGGLIALLASLLTFISHKLQHSHNHN